MKDCMKFGRRCTLKERAKCWLCEPKKQEGVAAGQREPSEASHTGIKLKDDGR